MHKHIVLHMWLTSFNRFGPIRVEIVIDSTFELYYNMLTVPFSYGDTVSEFAFSVWCESAGGTFPFSEHNYI